MHQIKERPSAICMSKNEIRYVYLVTSPSRLGLYFEVQLFYRRGDGTVDSSLPTMKLLPNKDGSVYVYLQYYIDSMLEYVLPTGSDLVTAAKKQSCSFYIAVREVEDTSVGVIAWDTAENANRRIALKMGIEKNRYSRNNLINYLNANNQFYTWLPKNRLIFSNQPSFLSFLLANGNSTGYQVKVVFQTIEGTNDDIIIELPILTSHLYHIATDFASLGIVVPDGERLHWYDVSIIDSNNLIVFGTYRYYIDYDTVYYYHDFIYTNSLGGIDTARAKGELQYSFERQTEEIEGGFTTNEWNTLIKNGETIYRAINLRRTFKGDLGYRKSKIEQDAMIELLASTAVYELLDGLMIPLLHIQKTQTLRKTTDQILPFVIEWQHAETNEVFTPNTIALGMGNDTEVYLPVYMGTTPSIIKLIINNRFCYLTDLNGIHVDTWAFVPLMYPNNDYTSSPQQFTFNRSLVASDINIISHHNEGVTGSSATAELYVNGVLIEMIDLVYDTATYFTSSLAIATTDYIEIHIN